MIVWTNGCFDVIHAGHIELFKYARSLGRKLVVGVDTDERVKNHKGEGRPVNCLTDRMNVLSSIKYIDEVVSFGSDQELVDKLIESGAGLMVIGDDYSGKRIIGSDRVKVQLFKRIPGKSSTRIINEIRF